MKIRKSDVIWNYIGTIMSLGSNFLLLPFIIYFLDGESLGLWCVFLSIGGIVVLFDFGFNPTLARNVAYSWSGAEKLSKIDAIFTNNGEPNIGLLKKIVNTSKKIYLLISSIALLVLLTVGTLYVLHISENMSGYDHMIAWIIYSFAVFLNLYYGYYATFLRGVGAIKEINIAIISARTFQIIASIVLLYFDFRLIAVAVAYLGYGMIFRLFSKLLFYRFHNIGEKLKTDNSKVTNEDIRETFNVIWHNAWRDGLVSLSSYLSKQASVVIASMYLSLTETGIYSISIQLVTAIASISGALYTSYQPSLQAAYINKDTNKSKTLMSIAMTVYILMFWIGIVILSTIGLPILSKIKPNTVFSLPILIAISVYEFLLKHHSYYASFISNTNNVPYVKAFLFSGALGVILAILLVRGTNLGVWGLIIAQILAQAIYNNWKWPSKVISAFETNIFEMIKIGSKNIFNKVSATR